MDGIVPQDYASWRHCIEVDCGIRLTPQWIEQADCGLKDPRDYHTSRFKALWGPTHHSMRVSAGSSRRARNSIDTRKPLRDGPCRRCCTARPRKCGNPRFVGHPETRP